MTKRINPTSQWSVAYRGTPGASYEPCNGTEGMAFMEAFCESCVHDKALNGTKDPDICDDADYCHIVAASMIFHINCKGYPPEWIYDEHGCPTCTAWEAIPEPKVRLSECERCPDTLDLFGEET